MYTPNQENKTKETNQKITFNYCNNEGSIIFKTKEIYKNENKIIFFPYNLNRLNNAITPKKIREIEFRGWKKIADLPKDFKKSNGYGLFGTNIKLLMSFLYQKFPEFAKLVVGLNIQNRFSTKTITINWADLDNILKQIQRERLLFIKNKKLTINNGLALITTKVEKVTKHLYPGELNFFINKFDSFEKMSTNDIISLSKVFESAPVSKISITKHFIQTKEKIDIAFLDEIIEEFEKLLNEKKDNEEKWQNIFEKRSWLLDHLFPYKVILRQSKAYVGGKTIENSDGRIVDFLLENGFKDNFALLEIKTHRKSILKKNPYRSPDVFSMSDELSGGINQCLDQKDIFLRELGKEYLSFDPKCILLIGLKSELNKNQSKCFELIRANQKNVDIVTFDELLSKIKGFQKVILSK